LDEALSLPSIESARIARNIQIILQEETEIANVRKRKILKRKSIFI
jgi:methylmalonyl-CoA mutase N-terminal domain/subunit